MKKTMIAIITLICLLLMLSGCQETTEQKIQRLEKEVEEARIRKDQAWDDLRQLEDWKKRYDDLKPNN